MLSLIVLFASTQPYSHVTHTSRCNREHHHGKGPATHPSYQRTGYASLTAIMRTYDDTFSGQKIYPGKVCLCSTPSPSFSLELRRLYTPPSSRSGILHLHGVGDQERARADLLVLFRASSTSVATAKFFASRTAKPSPSSCSARTLVALRGPCCSGGSIKRGLQR